MQCKCTCTLVEVILLNTKIHFFIQFKWDEFVVRICCFVVYADLFLILDFDVFIQTIALDLDYRFRCFHPEDVFISAAILRLLFDLSKLDDLRFYYFWCLYCWYYIILPIYYLYTYSLDCIVSRDTRLYLDSIENNRVRLGLWSEWIYQSNRCFD